MPYLRTSFGESIAEDILPMMVHLFIALQGAANAANPPLVPIDFDLRKVPASIEDGAIVVTGRRKDFRVDRLPDDTGPLLGRAETGLFGKVRADASVVRQEIAPGMVSQRIMVTIKLPF
jgi:hypothetical protein